MSRSVIAIVCLVACVLAQGGHHHEYRKYTCAKNVKGASDCALTLKKLRTDDKEFHANPNQGCFEENGAKGPSTICPLYCPETGAAYVIAKSPSNNHKCVNLDTYGCEQRNGEWFLRRSGVCKEQEMTFEIGCHFLYPAAQANVEQFFKKA